MEVTSDPSQNEELRDQQKRRNRQLMEELEAAGLLSGGPVPGSFVTNAAIVTGIVDPDDDKKEDDG